MKTVDELAAALPGEPIGYRRLGLALAERGDGAHAERLLNKAVDRDPGDSESWVALAQIYDQSGRLEKAEEAYSRALERDSDNTELLLALGRLALRQDSVVRAKAYFESLLSLSRDPELAVKVAFSYLATRHPAEAAEVLDAARATATEPRLHFYAGLVHERMRDFPRAALAFGAVPKEAGELYKEARVHQASALSSAGHHKQALQLFEIVHGESPDDAAVVAAWAKAYERSGQNKDAETLLKTTLSEKPTPDVFEALAELYQRQGRLADAVSLLSDALKKRPKDEVLLYTLGTVYERKGDFSKSLEKMRAVLDVNPDNANAMNFIGYTLADRGADFEEAERLLTRALELKPDNGNYLDSLGWVYFRKGDLQKAAEVLERAQSASPGEPTICEHLGDVYSRMSRPKEAVDSYKRALQSLKEDPDQADSPAQKSTIE
jgi:tetratricopeptide (TPR) repeat protein